MNTEKITIKEILIDRYDDFKNKYWYRVPENMRDHIDGLVNKAISCSDIKNGFAEYICEECGDITKVPFTCKSKFCNRCGRLYTLKWAERQQQNMLRVVLRYSVFTMPEDLRNFFYSRRELLKELQDGVYNVISHWYKKNKNCDYEVEVIAVIHTFGRDLKWNPHVHALVTEGAVDKNNKWWKSVEYIPYPFLKKAWQKVLLDIIKKHFNCYKTRQLISNMYKKYPKGFYVNAKRRLDDTRQAVKYIGRYLARAAIAEYRIEEYDGDNVTFWYEDHDDGHKTRVSMNVLEFIGKITQHIVPKGFKTVRRYGLYSRRRNKISKEIVHLYNFIKQMSIERLLRDKKQEVEKKKTWKGRIIDSFGRNPIQCKRCEIEKILWKIWHNDYGIIYDIRETRNVEDILYDPVSRTPLHRKVIQISLLKM
ncbi:IS91 family transposase [Clostridium magnum]|uniref:Putative transposase n=1 Tax=Clostridium magnum DSM 2767 TaxID=1121326 RepID=A0A161X3S5_9CLOT|nr:transposase [Clostridium magnum]KZL88456.1 putative transposase [Clostridium magnum DSM 2767]SHI90707.1 Transposase zinc-binding domain-containing protein [Clostridium magnum DSM 2767]